MNDFYLSFLMGAPTITNNDLRIINVGIERQDPDGDRGLRVAKKDIAKYIELVKEKLSPGFWNEIVGGKEIIFIFKFKDGSVKEYKLSPENEKEISKLCSEFNGDSEEKTANVYKYISGNKFYNEFMLENYFDLINRK
ncbi:hypothetical protein IT397_03190 [Candidatus Nomurabacteria bacterium]|nr:hypothetical protein [Candidatus Nomurabacteria bacterium]